jgi:prolyl-tRNA editing enzyme YbaK/EbsC (Cys-tRNA(Pro) deacylase)
VSSASETTGIKRVEAAAGALGLQITVRNMPQSTRTAVDAATACGCNIAEIVKSLVFEDTSDGRLVLLLVSGSHNVNLVGISENYGLELKRAEISRVHAETGFAIGGVAPIGHLKPLRTFIDKTLLAFDAVWAAAGGPQAVFQVDPRRLAAAIGAVPVDVT